MPGAYLWGWDGTTWVKVLVNAAGKLIIDPSEILEDTPTDGEVAKAPTSNWAHDHAALPNVHHVRQHAIDAAADHTGRIALTQMTDGAAGLVLTGQGAGSDPAYAAVSGGPTIVRKTANETVNNSANLQNDDELKFAIAANEVWDVYLKVFYTSSAVADFRAGVVGPAGCVINGVLHKFDLAGTFLMAGVGLDNYNAQGTVAGRWTSIHFTIRNGGTPGNLQFRWAQNTAEATNTIVYANSYVIAQKVG